MVLASLFGFLACAMHTAAPGPAPTPEGCQAGDLGMCRALAAAWSDSPIGPSLDRWACDAGYAPSCVALAATEPALAAADLAVACDHGDADACVAGAAMPDDVDARGYIGQMALRACGLARAARGKARARFDAACARAEAMGWRGEEVRDVRILRKVYTPHAVLPGGTVLSVNGGGVVASASIGTEHIPMKALPDHVDPGGVRGLAYTADGRLVALAFDPVVAWSMLDGTVTRLDTWPPKRDVQAQVDLAPDASAAAAELENLAGVAVWALPEGRLVGTFPRPAGKASFGLRVGVNGARVALLEKDRWRPVDPEASTVGEPRAGAFEGWLAGVDLPADAAPRASVSPDHRLVAVPEAEGVRLLRVDGTEVAHVALPPVGDNPVVHRLLWSADGGRLVVPLHGAVAVISTRVAHGVEADDTAILQRIQPPPALPPAGPPALAPGSVEGLVTVAKDAAPGAAVTAEPCAAGPATLHARADGAGRFAFDVIPRGCWRFSASGEGGLPADVVQEAVGVATHIDLALIATTRVSGVVLGADGRPASGATVRARLRDRYFRNGVAGRKHVVTAETRTDARGRFTLDPVPAEGFQLEAVRGGDGFVAPKVDPARLPDIQLGTALLVRATTDPRRTWAQVRALHDGKLTTGTLEPDGTWISTDFALGDVVDLSVWQAGKGGEGPSVRVTLPLTGEVSLQGSLLGRLHVVSGGRYAASIWLEDNLTCGQTIDGCETSWLPAGPIAVYAHDTDDHRVRCRGRGCTPRRRGDPRGCSPFIAHGRGRRAGGRRARQACAGR